MMIQFRTTPIYMGKDILENLYNKVDSEWKWALSTE